MKISAAAMALASLFAVSNAWTVTLYSDQDFGGDTATVTGQTGVCANVPGYINDAASSLKGDGGLSCQYFLDGSCGGGAVLTTGPGQTLSTVPSGANDDISSVNCQ